MGQYFKPINLDKKESIYTWDYASGLKLMEHSYFYNPVVVEVMILLMGNWKGNRMVWSGDYSENADEEWDKKEFPKVKPRSFKYERKNSDITESDFEKKLKPFIENLSKDHVLVNQDKKIYCQLDCCRENKSGFRISPLPLLLANSNGQGGGDYRGEKDIEKVGTWAYDHIAVLPIQDIPEDYKKETYDFNEEW